MIYLTGISEYALGYATFVSGYIRAEILSRLRCVCCMSEGVTPDLRSLHDRQLHPDGGWCLYHGIPLDYMVNEVPICQKLSVGVALVLVGPLVGFIHLVVMLLEGGISLLLYERCFSFPTWLH